MTTTKTHESLGDRRRVQATRKEKGAPGFLIGRGGVAWAACYLGWAACFLGSVLSLAGCDPNYASRQKGIDGGSDAPRASGGAPGNGGGSASGGNSGSGGAGGEVGATGGSTGSGGANGTGGSPGSGGQSGQDGTGGQNATGGQTGTGGIGGQTGTGGSSGGTNLLTNGDFSAGEAGWLFTVIQPVGGQASHGVRNGAYCATVGTGQQVAIGWPADNNAAISLSAGASYRLSYRASLSAGGTIQAKVGHVVTPFTAAFMAEVSPGSALQSFTHTFTTTAGDSGAGIAFIISGGGTEACVDDVVFTMN